MTVMVMVLTISHSSLHPNLLYAPEISHLLLAWRSSCVMMSQLVG
jgi:hypothetical protein